MVNAAWLRMFGNECWYCGCTLTYRSGTTDHRIPLRRGGSRKALNLVPACKKCNCMKGAKTEAEFLQDHPAFQQRHRFAPLLDQGELFIAFPVSLEPFDSHDPRHRVKLEGIVRHLMAIGLPNYAAVDEAMNYFAKEEEDGTDVATETGSRDD